jgi:hypothetical protein
MKNNHEEPEMTNFERKMYEILTKKQFIIKHMERLNDEYQALDREEERLEDEEFERTGIYTSTLDFDITITEEDLIKDLIKRTEGKKIIPDEPNQN